jgi:hypothetical protein
MKIKLAFLLICSFFAMSQAFSQKPNLPPPPTPSTPIDYYGMGYKTGYNLVVQGNMTVYQNSLTAAAASGNTPYYDGLLEGGAAAQQSRKPIKPQIVDYIVYDVTTVSFNFTDGSFSIVQYTIE